MKNPHPPLLETPNKTIKKDPAHRLSIAVKKLDQLINRAHKLGTFSDQLLCDDHSEPCLSHLEPTLIPQTPIPSFTNLIVSEKASEKCEDS